MPYHIESGIGSLNITDLEYTASGQRVRQVDGPELASTVKTFIGDLYERTSTTSLPPEHRYKVLVGSRQVAEVARSGGNESVYYLHDDHLGSVTTITNASGSAIETRSYDPFGAMTSQGAATGVLSSYTGHNDDAGLGRGIVRPA